MIIKSVSVNYLCFSGSSQMNMRLAVLEDDGPDVPDIGKFAQMLYLYFSFNFYSAF